MSKEIKALKSQLKDLADVLNGFESEYVQLKMLKMLTKAGYLDVVTEKKVKSGKTDEITHKAEEKSGKEGKRKKESKKGDQVSEEVNSSVSVADLMEKVDAVVLVENAKTEAAPVKVRRTKKATAKTTVEPSPVKAVGKTTRAAKAVKAVKTEKAVKAVKAVKTETKQQPKAKAGKSTGRPGRPTLANRPGPTSVLNALVIEGFFDEARSIGAIIEHCNKAQGWILKSTDISGILLGLVKKNLLIRRKNAVNEKYEYIKA